MELSCPNCGASIPGPSINVQKLIAVCTVCNTVYDFADDVRGAELNPDAETIKRKRHQSAPLPERFKVREREGELIITYSWFTPTAFLLIFFTLFWNGIVWTIFGGFTFGASVGGGPFFLFAFFPLIFVVVGLGLAYHTLTLFVNSTTITANDHALSIVHGPLPTFNTKAIDPANIGQLYVRQTVSRSDNRTRIAYDVRAVMHSGPAQKLVTGLREPDEAFYLEHRLEHFLGIENASVPGEFRGYV